MQFPDEALIIDTSHWDGVMNWEKAKPLIDGAIIKASDGTSLVDSQFKRSKDELIRLKIPWTAYHWFKPSYDPRKQAQFFASLIGHYDTFGCYVPEWTPKYDPVVDMEEHPLLWGKQAMTDALNAFLREFKAITATDCMIYTRASWWNENMTRTNFGKTNKLWVAHYNDAISEPTIPWDWQGYGWKIWQYSDHNTRGPELGATGSQMMDLNRYNGGKTAFRANLQLDGQVTPPPAPTPDPIPAPEPEPVKTKVVGIGKITANLNIRNEIIPSPKFGPVPGKTYKTSTILFVLPAGTEMELLEEIKDGNNIWVRVGQRQYAAKLFDGTTFVV